MKKMIVGYVGTLAGAALSMLTLASLAGQSPNYLVTAVLMIVALASLGVGWYGLSADKQVSPEAGEASGEASGEILRVTEQQPRRRMRKAA